MKAGQCHCEIADLKTSLPGTIVKTVTQAKATILLCFVLSGLKDYAFVRS